MESSVLSESRSMRISGSFEQLSWKTVEFGVVAALEYAARLTTPHAADARLALKSHMLTLVGINAGRRINDLGIVVFFWSHRS